MSGEITIEMILQAPGVMRFSEDGFTPNEAWPALEAALDVALAELIRMREREGKHLAKDLIHRLKIVRQSLKEVRKMHPAVAEKYRDSLRKRINQAGLDLEPNDDRLLKEIALFADRSDVSEEPTRSKVTLLNLRTFSARANRSAVPWNLLLRKFRVN